MSPPCRRAAALTSGHHPEPDPDLSSPGNLTSTSPALGPSALRSQAIRPWPPRSKRRVSVKEAREIPNDPGGLKLPDAAWARGTGGLRLLTGHFVGRANELSSLERNLD